MARMPAVLLLILCPLVAVAQDATHVARLEQEVRQLQRELLNLSQLVNELRARIDRPITTITPSGAALPRTTGGATREMPGNGPDARWVNAAQWQKLRPGMSELEVIELLGPPTSMRGQGSERVLLYALEIGNSGFLAGSITLRDRAAASIEIPTLK